MSTTATTTPNPARQAAAVKAAATRAANRAAAQAAAEAAAHATRELKTPHGSITAKAYWLTEGELCGAKLHPFDDEAGNRYVMPSGRVQCRECRKAYASNQRKNAAAAKVAA